MRNTVSLKTDLIVLGKVLKNLEQARELIKRSSDPGMVGVISAQLDTAIQEVESEFGSIHAELADRGEV